MPRRSSTASMLSTSRPSMKIGPPVGSIRRLIMRRVVVLPQPDGPTSTQSSPSTISRLSSSTATLPVP